MVLIILKTMQLCKDLIKKNNEVEVRLFCLTSIFYTKKHTLKTLMKGE